MDRHHTNPYRGILLTNKVEQAPQMSVLYHSVYIAKTTGTGKSKTTGRG